MLKLQRKRIQNTQLAVYISDTHVTLKQSEGHPTCNDIVDLKQVYNHANFGRSCVNGFREKFKICFCQTRKYVNYLP